MPIETGTKISDLNPLWPLGSDPKAQGDDHLRLIKAILQSDAVALSDTGSATIVEADASAGWQVVGDVLVQWGRGNFNTDVIFPQPFKDGGNVSIFITRTAGIPDSLVSVGGTTETRFSPKMRNWQSGDTTGTGGIHWAAIGEAPDSLKKPKTVQTIGSDPVQEFFDPTRANSWRIIGNTLEQWGVYSMQSIGGDLTLETVTLAKSYSAQGKFEVTVSPAGTINSIQLATGRPEAANKMILGYKRSTETAGLVAWHTIGEWDGN